MGECGCSNFNPMYKMAGPKGSIYVIEVNHPCLGCQSPAGLLFHKFTKKTDMRDWEINELPDLPFSDGSMTGTPFAAIAVVDPWLLKDIVVKAVEAYAKEPGAEIDVMSEVVREALDEVFDNQSLPGAGVADFKEEKDR